MRVRPPFKRKSALQRIVDTVDDQLSAAGSVTSDLSAMGSRRAVKTGLIAAGSVAGLTAGSAAISSLRRRVDRERGDS
jgi:hypothetical protein